MRGRVQGVWYRGAAQEVAERLGLAGWVRNRRDGSVEIVAEGEEGALRRLVEWCREGPPLARVSDVLAEPAPRDEHLQGFEIRPTV